MRFFSPTCLIFFLVFTRFTQGIRADPPFGYAWQGLKEVRQVLGAQTHHRNGGELVLSNHHHRLCFYPGRRRAELDGTVFWLNAPAAESGSPGEWQLARMDLDLIHLALFTQNEAPARPMCILLDPGHGGDDPGAISRNPKVYEKDLTLALAQQIGAKLKRAGMRVFYTRTHDQTLSLSERVAMARSHKAELFVSIHANHAPNTAAMGVETYVLPPSGYPGTAAGSRARGWQIGNRNDYHNTLLGFHVHRRLAAAADSTDRGLKRQSFFVLRETRCPAVLLEFGFLSNRDETERMLDPEWQEAQALAVTKGLLQYTRHVAALEQALTAKQTRDAARNARWRRHLAETTALAAQQTSQPSPSAPTTETVLAASATPAADQQSTNTAPAEIQTLIDFYGATARD